jgi:hypothetical protein
MLSLYVVTEGIGAEHEGANEVTVCDVIHSPPPPGQFGQVVREFRRPWPRFKRRIIHSYEVITMRPLAAHCSRRS